MKYKFAFVLIAFAALAIFAAGLDAQCGGAAKGGCGAAKGSCGSKQECGGGDQAVAKSGTVSTGALVALMRAKAPMTIVDARGKSDDAIPGAQILSDDCLGCSKTLAKTVGAKDRLVVTYCAGPKCPASSKMAAKLRAAGYTNVVEYREGAAGWKSLMASCGKSCADAKSCGETNTPPTPGKRGGGCPATADTAAMPASTVDTNGLRTLMLAKVPMVVLDARSGKWDDGNRIPGAIAFNCDGCMGKPEAMQKVLKSKDQLIVTYCGAEQCPLSSMLAKKLRTAGYTNVIEYKAGLVGWTGAGLKTLKQKADCCGTCGDKGDCGTKGDCGSKKGSCGSKAETKAAPVKKAPAKKAAGGC